MSKKSTVSVAKVIAFNFANSDVILENIRFIIKNGVSKLTLLMPNGRGKNEYIYHASW